MADLQHLNHDLSSLVQRSSTTSTNTPSSTLENVKTNVTSACAFCKRRKRKCNGDQPCDSCAHSKVDCVYVSSSDRRADSKRKAAALKRDSDCLDRLFQKIKESTDESIPALLNAVRTTSSIEDIESVLCQYPDKEPSQHHQTDCGNDSLSKRPTTPQSEFRKITDIKPIQHKPASKVRKITTIKPAHHNAAHSSSGGSASKQLTTLTAEGPVLSATHHTHPSIQSANIKLANNGSNNSCVDVPNHPQISYLVGQSQGWHQALRCNVKLLQEQYSDFYRLQAASPILHSSHDIRLPTFGNLPPSSAVKAGGFPNSVEEQQLRIFEEPEWAILPMSFDDSSSLCGVYLSFLEAAKVLLKRQSQSDLLWDDQPQVDLFFTSSCDFDNCNVGNWASSLTRSFEELEGAFRLIWILILYRFMKWMIHPSAASYASMLEISRPTLIQRMVPHRATFDLVHHRGLRDVLCRNPQDFISPLKGVSVCWPKQIDQAVSVRRSDGALYLTDEFVQHALNMTHWSYSASFLQTFPDLDYD